MKILHIAPIGHHAEGIGTVLMKLIPEQRVLGNDVFLISVHKNIVYSEINIPHIYQTKEFLSYINKVSPNIVVFHSTFEWPYISFYKTLKAKRIPYLIQLHGALSLSDYKKGHLKKWLAGKLFFNSFLKGACDIIYLNKSEYLNSLVPTINPEYSIIPNGCTILPAYPVRVLNNAVCDIVYIGRINIIHKGLDYLIDAIKILKQEGIINFRISIYGNETDKDVHFLRNMIRGLETLISYEGGIYGDDKTDRLLKSDMFILTSRYEGMPMGVLESLSCGIPCILSDGTNMSKEILEAKAGWECKQSAISIAETIKVAIEEYNNNPYLFSKNAYNLSKIYDWKKIACKTIDLYKQYS